MAPIQEEAEPEPLSPKDLKKKFDKFRSSNMDKFNERMKDSASEAQKAAQEEGAWRKDDLKKKAQAEKDKEMGAKDLAGLKKQMINRYGNLLRAWKLELDKNNTGKLSFVGFCNTCRDIGFAGPLKKLWKEMDDDDSGFITCAEWAPEAWTLQESFMKHLRSTHEGSLIKAWIQTLDSGKSGQCGKQQFIDALKKLWKEMDDDDS